MKLSYMKNKLVHFFPYSVKGIFFIALLTVVVQNISFAQLAVFPLRNPNVINNNTPQGQAQVSLTNPNIVTGTLTPGSSMQTASYNSQGYRVKTNSLAWPTSRTDGFGFDIPISPKPNYDMTITCITFNVYQPDTQFDLGAASHFTIVPYFQIDNAGPWRPLAAPQIVDLTTTSINFGAINETFYNGHTYVIRFYVYSTDGATSAKNDIFRVINLVFCGTVSTPPSVAPTVTTLTATSTGLYTANATGSFQFGAGYHTVSQSGFVWGTSVNPTYPSSGFSSNGAAGVLNSTLTGLTAGTLYHVRAYIITQFGTFYGADFSFTTSPPTTPTVVTGMPNPVLSNKAFGRCILVDSGGAYVTDKGLVWSSTLIPPTIAGVPTTNKISFGGGSGGIQPNTYSDWMKLLTPCTTYHVRAYATNANGTVYGGDSVFTTSCAATPTLTAIPGNIDFGENLFGANQLSISYSLSGAFLTGAPGNITITATGGYQLSLTNGPVWATSITVPYNGATLFSVPIYVQLPAAYGTHPGFITHTGGGTIPINADTVFLSGTVVQSPDNVTNNGNDFWLGFGYENKMKQNSGSGSEALLSVNVATGSQAATVTVSLPGIPGAIGFPQTFTIPANSTHAFTGFPAGDPSDYYNGSGMPDARLYYTGVSNRGIHVTSADGAPVSVWMYIAASGNSAGASMIFPTSTWNSSYTVQAYGGPSNNGLPNSFFFVIANEDNTQITFSPTSPIIDSTANTIFADNPPDIKYPAGGTYSVTLNRGQVFNAMGSITGSGNAASSAGFDLSGTTVSTTCDKKIAVFGGNGRCLVTTPLQCAAPTSGSDNMVQQMIPSVAWGTLYYTVPTKTMEWNLFRIYVRVAGTVVKVNGVVLGAGAYNATGKFYILETNQPSVISADNPISVTQFVIAGICATQGASSPIGLNGKGDPEMIILSAAQQSITGVTIYSPPFANGLAGASYINVVIPQTGVSSFKLDGAAVADTGTSSYNGILYGNSGSIPIANAFHPYTFDNTYAWAKFKVSSPANHTLSSAVGFNAIAYGMDPGESYGFNAGTAVKNLSAIKVAVNPNGTDTSTTSVRTCKDNLVTLKIALPHNPNTVDSIVWGNTTCDPRVTPSCGLTTGGITAGKATVTGTIIVDGITYNIYTCPVQYSFNQLGTYVINVTAYGTFASDCPGKEIQKISVIVGRDNVNFTYSALCGDPNVQFTNNTQAMVGSTIDSLLWNFGELPTTNSNVNPISHLYTTPGQTLFNVKLTTYNTYGCTSSDSVQVDISGGIRPKFLIAPTDTICTGSTITFDPTPSQITGNTAGTPVKWTWNFGPGEGADVVVNGATSPSQPHTYNIPGLFPVTLTLETSNGCKGVFKDSVVVEATPVAVISPNPTFVCLGDSAAYTDASTIAVGAITSWLWTFDDATTSTLKNPKHKWLTAGSHTVTLTVKSTGGCSSSNTASHTINVNPLPVAGFKYDLNCTTRTITFTDTSNANGGTINAWAWDFGDAASSLLQNPSHVYAASGTFTITLSVTTVNGCKSSVPLTKTITIAASPVADFTLPGNTCLPNASPVFTNTTTISDGTIALATYIWNFGDGTGDLTSPPLPVSPTHVFPGTGPYTISLTAISNNGCTNTKTKPYSTIFAAPVAKISPLAEACVNSTVNFSSASSTAAGSSVTGWSWNFGDGSVLSTSQNPIHSYTASGVKTVILTVTSAAGCSSAPDTAYITINALPTANFTDTVNCSTFSVGFSDISVANAGIINQWNWTFGDVTNNTSTVQNPTHVYPASGNYTVTLSVKTDKGCTSSTAFTNTVAIAARPVTDFTLPGNTCLPNANALFTNTTSISDGTLAAVTYAWDFGDTSGIVSSPPNPVSPSHVYNFTGNHTVILTATSSNGCVKSISKLYDKVFAQPTAVITAPAGVCLGNAASFSSASSTAPASSVTGWQWDFGDTPAPGSSTQQTPSYTYTGSGPRTVRLTVTSAAGCISAATMQAINVNLSPVAGFTYSAIRCKDSVVTFNDASVSNATGGITEWKWNFGDGSASALLTQTLLAPATHTFTAAQTNTVSLSIKNANGCVSSVAYSTPVVINPNPVSKFKVSDICIPVGLAQFTQQAAISSGQITNWLWDFGVTPVATSNLQNPTYNYTTGAVYQASLMVTSDSSCSASFVLPVTAYNTPTPLFDVTNPNSLCSNLPVGIVNKTAVNGFGTVDKVEVFWDYTNNPTVKTTFTSPALDAAFTNQYPVFGNQPSKTYRVLIRAYSGSGCSADHFEDINLLAAPKAQFTQPAPVCQEAPSFTLTGASDIFGLPGSGAFSGNGISSSPSFSPSLAGAGTQVIRYTYTTTAGGCVDFTEKNLVVNPTPGINFGGSTINVLEGDILKLSPAITNGASYLWTPATYLNSAVSATPFGLPTADISYNLKVISDRGCEFEKSVFIRVVKKYIVPNTFTPNHDGNHDTWEIDNLKYYPAVRVRVFNRSGQMVLESIGYNTPWDGTYKGKDMPFGTYYYVIETGGGRSPKTGYVTIIR